MPLQAANNYDGPMQNNSKMSAGNPGGIADATGVLKLEIDHLVEAITELRGALASLTHSRVVEKTAMTVISRSGVPEASSLAAQEIFKAIELLREQTRRIVDLTSSIDV